MRKRLVVAALGTLLAFAKLGQAQDAGDRVTVPFRDASKPRSVVVKLIQGGITVRGYDGKDAIVESTARGNRSHRSGRTPPDGMHRIDGMSGDLDIAEDNNVITINGGITRSADVTTQVPAQTSVRVQTLNGGAITIENIAGEIEAENMNGAVTVTNASGSVIANSMNGKINVSLNRVTAGKSMSFSTMNGSIDVTLPTDVKANLKMKTDNGEIYTDFDVKLDGTNHPPVVEDQRKSGGRYRVKMDKAMYGSINGGGPEMQFVTYNGNILIHKK
jgi:hypothetical protein